MRRRGVLSAVVVVVIAAAALGYTFLRSYAPLLGLDLQGGVSVVLQPKEEVSSEALDQAVAIIRQRVDALGVVEPEITRQDNTILVQIPGVEDRDRALELVGQTAELRFRPVLSAIPATAELSPESSASAEVEVEGPDGSTDTSAAPGEVGTTDTTAAPAEQQPSTAASLLPADVCVQGVEDDKDLPDQQVLLPQCEGDQLVMVYQLGPTALTGESLESASSGLEGGQWVVRPLFRSGEEGIDKFNAIASQCYNGEQGCPASQGSQGGRGQLAIVLDGEVISAPTINAASFQRDDISISGSFDESSASDLATALRYGALPVELEQQQVQIVSATLGQDALSAGLWAGLVGFIAVALFMIAIYKILGVLAILKLAVEAALLWSIISWLGATQGLALTLAGVTGLVVAIGVSVDSNVVFYEHLREDVRGGRSIRSAADRSFKDSWRTIFAADFASLLGALLLWWLTIGAVRGFALNLAIATVLDLFVARFFMGPIVRWALHTDAATRHPGWFGLPAEIDSSRTPPPGSHSRPEPIGVVS